MAHEHPFGDGWTERTYSDAWRTVSNFDVTVDPMTGHALLTVGRATREDVLAASARAAAAQIGWAATKPVDRAAALRSAARVLSDHAGTLCDWLVRESGAVRAKAEWEIAGSVGELAAAADLCCEAMDFELPSMMPNRRATARRVPLRCVARASRRNQGVKGGRIVTPVQQRWSPRTPSTRLFSVMRLLVPGVMYFADSADRTAMTTT